MKRLFSISIVVLVIFSGILSEASAGELAVDSSPAAKEGAPSDYVISPGDVIEISVYEEPDLNKTVQASEEGFITYPLIGRIKAVGLTTHDLENQITELLSKDYLVNPQVSVFVREYSKFSILGEVNNPGSYQLKGRISVLDAIALAGGLKPNADISKVRVIRRRDKEKITFEIDLTHIATSDKSQGKSVTLRAGDLIVVSEYGKFSIVGEVTQPGSYYLKSKIKLLDAIAMAGGLKDTADSKSVKVVRRVKDKEVTAEIDIALIASGEDERGNLPIKDADVIYVGRQEFGKISILGEVARPGSYELKRSMTVVEAIALAGGFTKIAIPNKTKVIRIERDGRKKVIYVRVDDIIKSGDKTQDTELKPDDIIVVPESFF